MGVYFIKVPMEGGDSQLVIMVIHSTRFPLLGQLMHS